MKPSGKKLSMTAMMGDLVAALHDVFVRKPKSALERTRERLRDLPKTNFDLGCSFADAGQWFDAIFRFRVVIFLNAAYPHVWYNLGCCYFRTGRHKQAAEALRKALAQEPSNMNARFMLASVAPEMLQAAERPTTMPKEMVTAFFTSVAAEYDVNEAAAGYQAGAVIHELTKSYVTATAPEILDVGCGTGIAARPWRAGAGRITGVDVTPAMITLAGKATHADKKLFDALYEAESAALPSGMGAMDLILLINTAQFIGELAPTLRAIATQLKPQGVAVISLEPYSGKGGFGLSADTGRFGHTTAYVKQVAQAAGLQLLHEAKAELYAGTANDILILRKA